MSRAGSPPAWRLAGPPPAERTAAMALRPWREDPDGPFAVEREPAAALGSDGAARACATFHAPLPMLSRTGRRPMRPGASYGGMATSDEAAFGRAAAAAGAGEAGAASWLPSGLPSGLLAAPPPDGAAAQAEVLGLLVQAAQGARFPGKPAAGASILD